MDTQAVRALFAPFGAVTAKRMFGGHGIYADGLVIAVQVQGEIYLKGDTASGPLYEAAGGARWMPEGKHGAVKMPFWSLPAGAHDDEAELVRWCRLALETARRVEAAKARKAGSLRANKTLKTRSESLKQN